jgi:hypothetical protein
MKRFLFLTLLILSFPLASATYVYAQESPPADVDFAVDLTTFTGIVAFVSLAVTQLAKIIPAVSQKNLLKILVSVGVAIVATLLAWHFSWAQFLQGLSWWMAVFYGVGAGLTAAGAYDLIKAFVSDK